MKVADFKRRFAEVLGRVRYRGERFIIVRRDQPMAVVVGLEDLDRLESEGARSQTTSGQGLLAAIGAWEEYEGLDRLVEGIYKSRKAAADRRVILRP